MERYETIATSDCLDGLHAALDRLWADGDVPDDQRARFTTGVHEIVANVVQHGRAARGRPVHLVLELEAAPDRLEARLEDDGEAVPYSENAMSDLEAESGRGLLLARAVFDELAYLRDDTGHNRWRMVLRLH